MRALSRGEVELARYRAPMFDSLRAGVSDLAGDRIGNNTLRLLALVFSSVSGWADGCSGQGFVKEGDPAKPNTVGHLQGVAGCMSALGASSFHTGILQDVLDAINAETVPDLKAIEKTLNLKVDLLIKDSM